MIDHVFHMIPGAHYKRMYGQDLNPHVYELMDSARTTSTGAAATGANHDKATSTTRPAAATPTRAR